MIRALALSLSLLAPWPAQAGVTADDLAEIKAVISRQIDLCAVQRPAQVTFLNLTVMGFDAVQQVRLKDGSGAVWHAYYAMQRQQDGSWRTNGCRLVQPAKTIPT
jgi:hypothetical protein